MCQPWENIPLVKAKQVQYVELQEDRILIGSISVTVQLLFWYVWLHRCTDVTKEAFSRNLADFPWNTLYNLHAVMTPTSAARLAALESSRAVSGQCQPQPVISEGCLVTWLLLQRTDHLPTAISNTKTEAILWPQRDVPCTVGMKTPTASPCLYYSIAPAARSPNRLSQSNHYHHSRERSFRRLVGNVAEYKWGGGGICRRHEVQE